MILSMYGQAWLFGITIVIGFGIGFIYDILRVLRRVFPHPNFLVQLEDILYWLFMSFIMFYIMLGKNFGEIRAFLIIGVFLGMILYFLTLSRMFINISMRLVGFIQKIITAIVTILMFPIRIIFNIVAIPLSFVAFSMRKVCGNIKKVLQKSRRYAKIKSKKAANNLKIILKKH